MGILKMCIWNILINIQVSLNVQYENEFSLFKFPFELVGTQWDINRKHIFKTFVVGGQISDGLVLREDQILSPCKFHNAVQQKFLVILLLPVLRLKKKKIQLNFPPLVGNKPGLRFITFSTLFEPKSFILNPSLGAACQWL